MAVEIRGSSDETLESIASVLAARQADRLGTRVARSRRDPCSIHVRVLDPWVESMSRGERGRLVWSNLARLTEAQRADINMLLLPTPEEIEDPFANSESRRSGSAAFA